MLTTRASTLGYIAALLPSLIVASCVSGPDGGDDSEYDAIEQDAYLSGGTPWSSPATWGGAVPKAGADVVVPAGKTVILDTNVTLRNLQIDGTVICADKDLAVTAAHVLVHGKLSCGTATAPFTKRLTITLTGNNPDEDVMGMGTKFLGAMGSGAIELHGAPRTAWVKLDATANAGATTVTIDRTSDWRAGDRIVLASTDFDMNQAEERTIKAVSGKTLTLDSPLKFMHFGVKQSFTGGKQSFTLDERGEIGLMNRNIVVQGDADSTATGLGGHIMAMAGATLHVANIEETRMGQRHKMGRYPFHWHLAGDVNGQYIKNSSIHHTFNRCITVHGSNNALVQSNLCYDNLGHAIFLEDGVEHGNVIEGNLGLVTRRPAEADALLPSDRGNRGADPLGPATFWITNSDNHVRNNVAAGSDGTGYWYSAHGAPTGLSKDVKMAVTPNRIPLTEFAGNVTHSDRGMAIVVGGSTDAGALSFYTPTATAVFKGTTYYKTRARGAWGHGTNMAFDGLVSADNVRGAFFSFNSSLTNSIIVGESGNRGTPVSDLEKKLGRSLADPNGAVLGYLLYDGPVTFTNVHFAGFGRDAQNVYGIANNGGATQNVDNHFQGITFAADTRRIYPDSFDFNPNNGQRHAAIIDVDGSISRRAGSTLIPNLPMNTNSHCAKGPWSSSLWASCENTYGLVRVQPDFGQGTGKGLIDISVTRSDGPNITLNDVNQLFYQLGAILDQGYRYHYAFPAGQFPQHTGVSLSGPAGKSTVIELSPAPAGAQVKNGTTVLPSASSLADLEAGAPQRAFRSGSSLFVKLSGGAKLLVE